MPGTARLGARRPLPVKVSPGAPTHAPREGAEPAPATAPGVTGNGMDGGGDARQLHAEPGTGKTGYGYAPKGVFEAKSLPVQ